MPTVPTEQNRNGIASVTDAKLQPGDYSGTGLQAVGAGMQQLGATGASIAGDVQVRQDRDDGYEVKKAWNTYAESAREIRTATLGAFDADPKAALESTTQAYRTLREDIRASLKNDRQRAQFDHAITERFDYDLSGASTAAEQALRRGQDQQGLRLEQNAADDAVANRDQPALSDKHTETGVDSIMHRGLERGDDPATIAESVFAFRSGIARRATVRSIESDPIAAANRYRILRPQMTPEDQQATERALFEPLAQAQAAQDVEGFMAAGSPGTALSAEQRAAVTEAIDAQPWNEARKRYAQDNLADRGAEQTRSRKQAASTARDSGFAIADHLGPDFRSITQIPPDVRGNFDQETEEALRTLAQTNLNPTPVAPGGETSLMMNIMASENPAEFVSQDLRLIRGRVTPEEYERFERLQHGPRDFQSAHSATQRRVTRAISSIGPVKASDLQGPISASLGEIVEPPANGNHADARFIKIGQDGGSFGQDRAIAWELARERVGDLEQVRRDMLALPRRELRGPHTLTPLHERLKKLAQKYPPEPGTPEWDTAKLIRWQTIGGPSFIFDFKDKWVRGHRRAITAAAKEFDLPPELIAGVAYNEVGGDPAWIDAAAYNVRGDKEKRRTSFGSLSLQVRSAADALGYTNPGSWQDAAIIGSLNNSQENIFIAAKFLSRLRNIDFKGRHAASLTKKDISIIASRFNRGPGLPLGEIKKDTGYGRAILKRLTHIRNLLK